MQEFADSINQKFDSAITYVQSDRNIVSISSDKYSFIIRPRLFGKIECKKGNGSNLIPTDLHKISAAWLVQPLTHQFNLSIEGEVFPRRWSEFLHNA